MILENTVHSDGNCQGEPGKSDRRGRRLWPVLINCWIAATLVMFLMICILGSTMFRHVLGLRAAH